VAEGFADSLDIKHCNAVVFYINPRSVTYVIIKAVSILLSV